MSSSSDRLVALCERLSAVADDQSREAIADEIIAWTRAKYDEIGLRYSEIRGDEIPGFDRPNWDNLKAAVASTWPSLARPRLLDIGTAYGRDIIHARTLGFEAVGIESAPAFLTILARRAEAGSIPRGSFHAMDARDLSAFPDGSFHVVRENASLVHMPLVLGRTVDRALGEACRVLEPGGILHVTLKRGDGFHPVESADGLGLFPVQHYSPEAATRVIERNGFRLEMMSQRDDSRMRSVAWLTILARKATDPR